MTQTNHLTLKHSMGSVDWIIQLILTSLLRKNTKWMSKCNWMSRCLNCIKVKCKKRNIFMTHWRQATESLIQVHRDDDRSSVIFMPWESRAPTAPYAFELPSLYFDVRRRSALKSLLIILRYYSEYNSSFSPSVCIWINIICAAIHRKRRLWNVTQINTQHYLFHFSYLSGSMKSTA